MLLQLIFVLGYVALVLTLYANPSDARLIPIRRDYGHPLYRAVRSRRLVRLCLRRWRAGSPSCSS